MAKQVTITLPDEVADWLAIRSAMSDFRLEDGLAAYLTEVYRIKGRKPTAYSPDYGGGKTGGEKWV